MELDTICQEEFSTTGRINMFKLHSEVVAKINQLTDMERISFLMDVGSDIGDALGQIVIVFEEGLCSPQIFVDLGEAHTVIDIDSVIYEMYKRIRKQRLYRTKPGLKYDILMVECSRYF